VAAVYRSSLLAGFDGRQPVRGLRKLLHKLKPQGPERGNGNHQFALNPPLPEILVDQLLELRLVPIAEDRERSVETLGTDEVLEALPVIEQKVAVEHLQKSHCGQLFLSPEQQNIVEQRFVRADEALQPGHNLRLAQDAIQLVGRNRETFQNGRLQGRIAPQELAPGFYRKVFDQTFEEACGQRGRHPPGAQISRHEGLSSNTHGRGIT